MRVAALYDIVAGTRVLEALRSSMVDADTVDAFNASLNVALMPALVATLVLALAGATPVIVGATMSATNTRSAQKLPAEYSSVGKLAVAPYLYTPFGPSSPLASARN